MKNKIIAISTSIILLFSVLLGGCNTAVDLIDYITEEEPSPETTLTQKTDINSRIDSALKSGKKKITIDIEKRLGDVADIMDTFPPFWGSPVEYREVKTFDDVVRIELSLELSANYHVYKAYTDSSYKIPSAESKAAEIFAALPEILAEVQTNAAKISGKPTYAAALAVHDWLTKNVAYDNTLNQLSYQNGIYGAIIERKTMCLGYTEAMQLLMLCLGQSGVSMVVGTANSGDGNWVGHAWNLVSIDGKWMHVDATFDDPENKTDAAADTINHVYFGQTDKVMQQDHKWEVEFYPTADQIDFFYYRTNGTYISDKKEYRKIIRKLLQGKPKDIELALAGFTISDNDIQTIYSIDDEISEIYRSTATHGNITLIHLYLEY